ncbi:MAG: hypothetical protein OXM88_16295 [bacterium]|nr:hypothetical protein [bacterium]
MRTDASTKQYVVKRHAEGKERTEIIRCLKRHIAPQIYRLITNPPPTPSCAANANKLTSPRPTPPKPSEPTPAASQHSS